MVINCHVYQVNGEEKELTPILDAIDPITVRSLILFYPFYMPQVIHTFTILYGLEVYNSTLIAL